MPGLRERKKEITRNAILHHANKHFREKGFASTTTAQIAKDAGIAEGTLFNYYSSKGSLFVDALFSSGENPERPEKLVRAATLSEAVGKTMEVVRYRLDWMAAVPPDLLQEYFSISYSPARKEGEESLNSLMEMDFHQISLISQVIGKTAATIVYHHVIMNFIRFTYDSALTYEKCLEEMEQHIYFSLKGHFPQGDHNED